MFDVIVDGTALGWVDDGCWSLGCWPRMSRPRSTGVTSTLAMRWGGVVRLLPLMENPG